jgi:hypothetical protein
LWQAFMQDAPDAHGHAVSEIQRRIPQSEISNALRLLPSDEDHWLTPSALKNVTHSSSSSLRIVKPRGRIAGPMATVVVTGLDLNGLKWSVHLNNGRLLSSCESEGEGRFRMPGVLPPDMDLVLTVSRTGDTEVLARSTFRMASSDDRARWKQDLAALTRFVSGRGPRLYGQMILAMKGGFHGAAAEVAAQVQGDRAKGYLRRLLFLHRFHGRVDAAEGVREILEGLSLESPPVPR